MPLHVDDFDSHAPQEVHDCFLSYNSKDRDEVEEIAHRLADYGLSCFFDPWHAVPGASAQETLERAFGRSRSCVVCWGPSGLGPWQTLEVRAAIDEWVANPDFRVIPASG